MAVETATQELTFWLPTETAVQGGGVRHAYLGTPTGTNVPCEITQESNNWARRQFGTDKKGSYRGLIGDWWNVTEHTLVLVTEGAHSGRYLMVLDAIPLIEEAEVVLVMEATKARP